MRSIHFHRVLDTPRVVTRGQQLLDALFCALAIVVVCGLFGWGLDTDVRAAQEDSERHARRHGVLPAEAAAAPARVQATVTGSAPCVAE